MEGARRRGGLEGRGQFINQERKQRVLLEAKRVDYNQQTLAAGQEGIIGQNGLTDQVGITESQCAGEQRKIPAVAFNQFRPACY